jgi:hypothetical protein
MKDRIRVLLACNANRNGKLPPLVTGKRENPLCFKNVGKLSTEYVNKKTWVIQVMFINCSRACMIKQVLKNMKILLFIDQCAVYPQDTSYLKNEKIVFCPQTAPKFSNYSTRE